MGIIFAGQAWGASYLANFTVQNAGFSETYKFHIDIYAASTGDDFGLGVCTLQIDFNDAALSNPVLSDQNADFNDNTGYLPMTVSAVGGVATFTIQPTPTNATGTVLPSTPTLLARITFDIDPSEIAQTSGITPSPGTSQVYTTGGSPAPVTLNFTGSLDDSLHCQPSISATSPTAITGTAFSFTPTVSGGCNPVTFKIQNRPDWTAFDTSTGELSGTPTCANGFGDPYAGQDDDFCITVVDPAGDKASTKLFHMNIMMTNDCAKSEGCFISVLAP